jgi:hypothetical protein
MPKSVKIKKNFLKYMVKSKSEIKSAGQNPGQEVIRQIRQAYLEGSLSVSNNPTPEVQSILNKPVKIQPKLYKANPKDKTFLKEIIEKVDSGEIKLFTPSTLLNTAVYDRLSPQMKSKADYDILTLLSKIRQVKKLWDAGEKDSYQILNLVNSLRLTKESLESAEGDVFII